MKIYFLGYVFNIGRNDPCFCKSGKKFKMCCLRQIDGENPVEEIMNRPTLRPRRWIGPREKWGNKQRGNRYHK